MAKNNSEVNINIFIKNSLNSFQCHKEADRGKEKEKKDNNNKKCKFNKNKKKKSLFQNVLLIFCGIIIQ